MSAHCQKSGMEVNPLEPTSSLLPNSGASQVEALLHPQDVVAPEDSAVTKAEKYERHAATEQFQESAAKRVKLDLGPEENGAGQTHTGSERRKGVAPIKAEFLIRQPGQTANEVIDRADDDAAEGAAHLPDARERGSKRKEKSKGQNTNRQFGSSRDEIGLCQSRTHSSEFSPGECRFGNNCKFEHDLRKYLKEWKREDLTTFGGLCPVWDLKGTCDMGWKCRFVGSHMAEEDVDGKKQLVLVEKAAGSKKSQDEILNVVSTQAKADLMKRKMKTPKADKYNQWLEKSNQTGREQDHQSSQLKHDDDANGTEVKEEEDVRQENRARYTEPPFLPSEKRKLYFGPETPVLAPLTTQGNMPFRRLCIGFGAQITYSEMAMSMPLIQGQKSEWALMRAHGSEAAPPKYNATKSVVDVYDNSKDSRFGAQIAANKAWQALKTTELLTQLCPKLRVIDLNCGCPIDLVYRTGAGSALLDRASKLESILRGMNAVSDEIPVTVKIRMGTKDNKPTAESLVERLVNGSQASYESGLGPCGVAAITLHGRSRQQRYTRSADWGYISDCAALIQRYNNQSDELSDTIKEEDESQQPASGKVYFVGNGDCYSHTDYEQHIREAKVDSVMVARGALVKPWIFEEIEKGQYIDKSASERLSMIEQYVRYGLEAWGSDEMGVGQTRRFLLEWLSFAYRYVPVGILEHLPPRLQDRPPAWRGRNELETLLGSDNYKDWIKISEMFLGPAHKDFNFAPKHKSNSYEIEAEG
ncbi:MAG: hypothetical protein Q9195_000225 [Heterodermia aff. obscurata]